MGPSAAANDVVSAKANSTATGRRKHVVATIDMAMNR
jgi:hypothetical protein